MKLFDAHCHYNDEKFDIDRDMLIKEVHDSGVVGMILFMLQLEYLQMMLQKIMFLILKKLKSY